MTLSFLPTASLMTLPDSVMNTVLYVNYYASPVSTRFLDGVFRYAHEVKWNVQVIDKVSESALKKLVEF